MWLISLTMMPDYLKDMLYKLNELNLQLLDLDKNTVKACILRDSLPAIQETWVQSLGWEGPLEKGMSTHSSILTWRFPWTEEPGGAVDGATKTWTQLSNFHMYII